MKSLFSGLLALAFLAGCATATEKKNSIKDVDTRLKEEKEVSGGDRLGLRDDKVKVQKKVLLAEELRGLENEVYNMENEVYGNRQFGTKGLYGVYFECMGELNSVELGGSGKLAPIEPPAKVIKEDQDLTFGRDEKGDLVGISEEYLSERIERFKKYRDVLSKRRSEYELKVQICENDVKAAKARTRKIKADKLDQE